MLLASFDKAQEFTVTITEGGRITTKSVSDTLEGVMNRGRKYLAGAADRAYDQRKQEWSRKHPEASPKEYEQACRAIARELGL